MLLSVKYNVVKCEVCVTFILVYRLDDVISSCNIMYRKT